MRFDWYEATIAAEPREVLDRLCEAYGADSAALPTKAMNGYRQACEVVAGGLRRALVQFGGCGGRRDMDLPHAQASGEDTDRFVEVMRGAFGVDKHVVSRFDSAEDFDAVGAFDALQVMALGIADARGIKVDHRGDWHRNVAGRTLYFGSGQSAVRVRLYEKGKQLRGLGGPGLLASPEWARLEVQVRPKGEARSTAAVATPEEAWGFARWTCELAKLACGSTVPRVRMQVWRESDDERAFRFMCAQYGGMLERLALELGDFACVGKTIGEEIAHAKRRR